MQRRTVVVADHSKQKITTGSGVVWLHEQVAADPVLAGAKAANLARAAALGLPVLPGFVLTVDASVDAPATRRVLRSAWEFLAPDGKPVVVRSSSTVEDAETSSMAGVFTSVLDVGGWDAFLAAVAAVRASGHDHPMAVLVQPMLDAALGGVLFGVDPVTGRPDRLLIESVVGGPAPLVSGEVTGTRLVLSPRGRVLESDGGRRQTLARRTRVDLARLARSTAAAFGRPQDVEWAVDRDGRLWLLQSRAVTATTAEGTGRVFGPGPVAETFPDALSRLEADLWLAPLREGVRGALEIAGGVPKGALRESPLVVSVRGRLAADLALLGTHDGERSFVARLDPRPPARRVGAAWRVGRLRRALPLLAGDVIDGVDGRLRDVPPLDQLDDGHLLAALARTSELLRSVHAHEVLAGILGETSGAGATGAAVGLDAIARGRAAGRSDAEIIASSPVSLALSAPRIGHPLRLPDIAITMMEPADLSDLGPREALRLRARWLHELAARAACVLGDRLVDRGVLLAPEHVRHLDSAELTAIVGGAPAPSDLAARIATPETAPLPTSFRLTTDGAPIPVPAKRRKKAKVAAGRGAGGGRGVGIVHDIAAGPAPPGTVLVVRTLDPSLAGMLPGLAGLVAETGSVLSHLAILAREFGVATVVAVDGAVDRFPPGTRLVVDGITGDVTLEEGVRP